MPKTGPTPDDWENKLRQYAAKKMTFGTGERPKKAPYKQKLEAIERCVIYTGMQKMWSKADRKCTCTYHLGDIDQAKNDNIASNLSKSSNARTEDVPQGIY
jgi:hypothetical protein